MILGQLAWMHSVKQESLSPTRWTPEVLLWLLYVHSDNHNQHLPICTHTYAHSHTHTHRDRNRFKKKKYSQLHLLDLLVEWNYVCLSPCTKINSKWIKDVNVNLKRSPIAQELTNKITWNLSCVTKESEEWLQSERKKRPAIYQTGNCPKSEKLCVRINLICRHSHLLSFKCYSFWHFCLLFDVILQIP